MLLASYADLLWGGKIAWRANRRYAYVAVQYRSIVAIPCEERISCSFSHSYSHWSWTSTTSLLDLQAAYRSRRTLKRKRKCTRTAWLGGHCIAGHHCNTTHRHKDGIKHVYVKRIWSKCYKLKTHCWSPKTVSLKGWCMIVPVQCIKWRAPFEPF